MKRKFRFVEVELSRDEAEAVEDFREARKLASPSSAVRLLVRKGLNESHETIANGANGEPGDTKLH